MNHSKTFLFDYPGIVVAFASASQWESQRRSQPATDGRHVRPRKPSPPIRVS